MLSGERIADPFGNVGGMVDDALKILGDHQQLQEDLAGAETRGDAAEQALFYKDTVLTDMSAVRAAADEAESLTAGEAWPFPTYADLLYGV